MQPLIKSQAGEQRKNDEKQREIGDKTFVSGGASCSVALKVVQIALLQR
jgi:hypothetical protein